MKLLAKTFPFLLIKIGCAQTALDYSAIKIDYGYSTSTFSGITLNNFTANKTVTESDITKSKFSKPVLMPSYNYGWKQGVFLWVNLSPCYAYRPEVNVSFCITSHKNPSSKTKKTIYSTSVGFEFKPQLIIRIGCRNTDPIIKMARNMSYYLTQKQTYLIVGPKFCYQKSDKAFLKKNNERNYSTGFVFGIGSDHLFPNLDVAPELVMSLEYQTGNNHEQKKDSNRYYTSLSLAMNFF